MILNSDSLTGCTPTVADTCQHHQPQCASSNLSSHNVYATVQIKDRTQGEQPPWPTVHCSYLVCYALQLGMLLQ